MARIAHVVTADQQQNALDMLTLASERVIEQAALVSDRASEVAQGISGADDLVRLGALSSYLDRLIEERQEYERFAQFLGVHRDQPLAYLAAITGGEQEDYDEPLGTEEELARLREALTA